MLLAIFSLILIINIIGFYNRKRAWSKIYLVSQVLIVCGMAVMFNVSNTQRGIQGIEAKNKKGHVDTVDTEKETQSSQQVKGF